MSRVIFAPLAEADLDEILEYIAHDKPRAAVDFVARLREKCYALGAHPEIGQRRPELGTDLRSFAVGNYVIIYRPISEGAEIARVVSGHRDSDALF